ncbi:MAG TPA: PASTA domain-containing protein [Clostridiales bacterium]|nr:PASTA domain-containing protein [Clostridiales bacterium]
MSELCLGCMKENDGEDICPFCNFPKDAVQSSPFLPLGTVLKNKYIVGKVLDNRSDSTRYIGYDKDKKTSVTIREFMPKGMFSRLEGSTVITVNENSTEIFSKLQEQFVSLAKNVARFDDCTALVPIYEVFDDNNTSYAVEDNEDVIPFVEYISRSGGSLEWDIARPLFMPLLSAMSKLNHENIYHFAICPANLVVTPAGKIRLTNFAIEAIRQADGVLPAQLFSGCSALEQYDKTEVLDEATDVYGFTATLFFALTGNLPADAVKRKDDSRLLMSTSVVKRLPPHVISALANGLQVEKHNRIDNFETLRAELSAAPTVQAIQEEIAKPAVMPVIDDEKEDKHKVSNFQWGAIALVVGLAIFGVLGYFWYSTNPFNGMFDQNSGATDASADVNPSDVAGEDFTYPADSPYFRIPNLLGKTFDDANAVANQSNEYQIFKEIDTEFSDTVPEGQICKQIPEQNMTVTRGNDGVTIAVVISKGAQYRALPKVDNVRKDEVSSQLEGMGFIVNSTLDYSDTVPEGSVISYVGNNKFGDKLEYGSTVTVCVSLGKKPESATTGNFVFEDPTT